MQFLKVQALGQKLCLALSKDPKTVLRSLMATPFNPDGRRFTEDIPSFIKDVNQIAASAPAAAPTASSGAPAAAPAASSGDGEAAAPAPPSGDGEAAAPAAASAVAA